METSQGRANMAQNYTKCSGGTPVSRFIPIAWVRGDQQKKYAALGLNFLSVKCFLPKRS